MNSKSPSRSRRGGTRLQLAPPAKTAPITASTEASQQPVDQSNAQTLAVDWSRVDRQPFRRAFLDRYETSDPEGAQAKRSRLGIVIESDPAGAGLTPPPLDSFPELSVFPPWLEIALGENNWDKPMPIQAQALPILLNGRNLIGIAQTGSGKTGAFLLPAIIHVGDQPPLSWKSPGPIVLVLAPTRELAVQISDEAEKLLKYSNQSRQHPGGLRSVCFYGGGKKFEQLRKFTYDGSHIAVATPGRLLDFCREGKVSLHRVTYLCLDEADRMLDMGFHGDMTEIGSAIRPERQTVFFSATWPQEVQSLACNLCSNEPVTLRVMRAPNGSSAGSPGEAGDEDSQVLLAREGIVQQVVVVDFPEEGKPWEKQDEEKRRLLDAHIKQVFAEDVESKMLIFVNQKNFATELSDKLWGDGIMVDAIHGGRPQETRLRILDQFRKGETRLLIATDVIGRGLDIPKVSHVVIYSMNGVEDYIHRIGRTGRGKDGKGHALVFFEFAHNQPDTAQELITVLHKSKQPVPDALTNIANDVASGKRKSWSRNQGDTSSWWKSSWSSGGGGNWKEGWKEAWKEGWKEKV